MLMGPAGLSLFEISLRQTMETSTHTVTSLCPYPLIFSQLTFTLGVEGGEFGCVGTCL